MVSSCIFFDCWGLLQRLALRDTILVEQFTGEDVGTEGPRHIIERKAGCINIIQTLQTKRNGEKQQNEF